MDSDQLIELGKQLLVAGQYQEALEKYQQVIDMDPPDLDKAFVYYSCGIALTGLQRYEEAIDRCQQAIGINTQISGFYYSYGVALAKLERYEEAIVQYQKAIDMDPQYALSYYNYGGVLKELGQAEEALEKYKQFIILTFEKISNVEDYNREFFKFRGITKNTLSSLCNGEVFFQTPSQFNDPLDCPLISRIQDTKKLPEVMRTLMESIRVLSLCGDGGRAQSEGTDKPYENVLMWSHYADQHKGLCIGYRFKPALFDKHDLCLSSINYTEVISHNYLQREESLITTGFFQKYRCWQYEREARIIWLPEDNDRQSIDTSDGIEINSVTFGYKTEDSDIQLVKQLLGDEINYFKMDYSYSEKLERTII